MINNRLLLQFIWNLMNMISAPVRLVNACECIKIVEADDTTHSAVMGGMMI